ncbi:MAG: 50S ribosomal protein L24 [bacterium]
MPALKKPHVKRGDEVVVLSGAHRGKKGKVLQVLPKRSRVLVEGVNLIKKSVKPTQANPKGGFEEREALLHISNVKTVSEKTAKKAQE